MTERTARRPCPRCPGAPPLGPVTDQGITLDYCGACHGVWLDQAEWTPIVGLSRSASRPAGVRLEFVAPPCPACSTGEVPDGVERPGLVPRGLEGMPGIEIDVCGRCGGAWLDGGELNRVREQVERLRREAQRRQDSAPAREDARPRRAALAREESAAMSFLQALRDTWGNLWG